MEAGIVFFSTECIHQTNNLIDELKHQLFKDVDVKHIASTLGIQDSIISSHITICKSLTESPDHSSHLISKLKYFYEHLLIMHDFWHLTPFLYMNRFVLADFLMQSGLAIDNPESLCDYNKYMNDWSNYDLNYDYFKYEMPRSVMISILENVSIYRNVSIASEIDTKTSEVIAIIKLWR